MPTMPPDLQLPGTVLIIQIQIWPRLQINFVFPTIGSSEAPMREASTRKVDTYIASVRDQLRSTLREVQAQSTTEACQQK